MAFEKLTANLANLGGITRVVAGVFAGWIVISLLLGFYWDFEPELFDVNATTQDYAADRGLNATVGSATVATTIAMADTLLNKRGGYLSNDVAPPSVFMDNIPNWEFGVVVQIRDMTRALRNNMSRSQSQSQEDPDLQVAEGQFFFSNDKWILPPTEGEYSKGIERLDNYGKRLADPATANAQFFARADNLRLWLGEVETRLGSLTQRLSQSVGQRQVNTDLAGDSAAAQSTAAPEELRIKTPWLELDDVFYEARGQTWALVHLLKAVEVDFHDVLVDKNALVSLRQIIRQLEATQQTIWSPIILNGSGFGMMTNHSLVMASYIASANASIIDLRNLLQQG